MSLPFPRPENITGLVDVMNYVNTVTGGMLGYSIILIVTIVTYVALMDFPTKVALPPAMFVGFVTSTFLAMLGTVPPSIPLILLFPLAASIAMRFFSDN